MGGKRRVGNGKGGKGREEKRREENSSERNWPPHFIEDVRDVACRDARMSLQVKSRQGRTTRQWVCEQNTESEPPTDGMPDNHDYPGLNLSRTE